MNCKVIAIENQKGGTGKSTTALNLGVGLKMKGKKVLIIDADPQGSLSISLGIKRPDELDVSLATLMSKVIDNKPFDDDYDIIHCSEGIDLMEWSLLIFTPMKELQEQVSARAKSLNE